MALNVGAVMEALADSMLGVGGLNTYAYPPASAQAPFAFVDPPETIQYDLTYGRGADRFTVQVFVGVHQVEISNLETTKAVCEYAAGSGTYSLKAAIENGPLKGSVRVTQCSFETIGLAGNLYAGLLLTVDVAG